jgi:hypothetical protein
MIFRLLVVSEQSEYYWRNDTRGIELLGLSDDSAAFDARILTSLFINGIIPRSIIAEVLVDKYTD